MKKSWHSSCHTTSMMNVRFVSNWSFTVRQKHVLAHSFSAAGSSPTTNHMLANSDRRGSSVLVLQLQLWRGLRLLHNVFFTPESWILKLSVSQKMATACWREAFGKDLDLMQYENSNVLPLMVYFNTPGGQRRFHRSDFTLARKKRAFSLKLEPPSSAFTSVVFVERTNQM